MKKKSVLMALENITDLLESSALLTRELKNEYSKAMFVAHECTLSTDVSEFFVPGEVSMDSDEEV